MHYPLILYILSFNHDIFHQLVSKKSLSKYAAGQRVSLPSVLNILREYATVLFSTRFKSSICKISASIGNVSALQWVRYPNSLTDTSELPSNLNICTTTNPYEPCSWMCCGRDEVSLGCIEVVEEWSKAAHGIWLHILKLLQAVTCWPYCSGLGGKAAIWTAAHFLAQLGWSLGSVARSGWGVKAAHGTALHVLLLLWVATCLAVLRWLRSEGCLWDSNTCFPGAAKGSYVRRLLGAVNWQSCSGWWVKAVSGTAIRVLKLLWLAIWNYYSGRKVKAALRAQ